MPHRPHRRPVQVLINTYRGQPAKRAILLSQLKKGAWPVRGRAFCWYTASYSHASRAQAYIRLKIWPALAKPSRICW